MQQTRQASACRLGLPDALPVPVRRLALDAGAAPRILVGAVPHLAAPVTLVPPIVAVDLHAHVRLTSNVYIILTHIWVICIVNIWVIPIV